MWVMLLAKVGSVCKDVVKEAVKCMREVLAVGIKEEVKEGKGGGVLEELLEIRVIHARLYAEMLCSEE